MGALRTRCDPIYWGHLYNACEVHVSVHKRPLYGLWNVLVCEDLQSIECAVSSSNIIGKNYKLILVL